MRRSIEAFIAAAALISTSPLLVVVALLIYLADRESPFFKQVRVGKDEQPFTLYKFRTMKVGTPDVTTHNLSADTVTSVGAFLRRAKLDELPQLVNVLRGEMFFVGPRPGLPGDLALLEERRKRGVFAIRPGITGLAQVRGVDMSDPARLAEIDASYVNQRDLRTDISIIRRTVSGDGAGDRLAPSSTSQTATQQSNPTNV